ncbi:MAG: hypothetical protein WBB17_10400 [Saprospiraceae bacterium]|jgi:hypothetical protein
MLKEIFPVINSGDKAKVFEGYISMGYGHDDFFCKNKVLDLDVQ